MDPTGKTFPSEDPRKWIGRILMAVILGEAIWNLIVSIMNNLVVPWLGDLFGQSSGLPTSFTQRPYNYPDLFVSFLEFCIAGLVAAIINYFFQRPRAVRVKPGKSPVLVPPVEPVRLVPRTEAPAAHSQMVTAPATAQPAPTPPTLTKSATLAPPTPVVKPDPIIPTPVIAAPPKPVPAVAPTPIAKPSPVAPVPPPAAGSVAKPQPAPPKAEPAKPKKSKEVYYNIVGEPMPSDED
jgi:hypothetical protein